MQDSPISIPVLETERLILRAHRSSDFADCLALWNDPEVSRVLLKGAGSSVQDVWFRMLRYRGLWALLNFGYLAVIEKATGQFVGEVGLADFKRATEPALGDDPEIGWAIRSSASGRGFATEAVGALLEWADSRLEQRRTICVINPTNAPSLRVAEKFGYDRCGMCKLGDSTLQLLERCLFEPPLPASAIQG